MDLWPLLMDLKHHHRFHVEDDSDFLVADPALDIQMDPKKELRALRASHGGLDLAAKLGTVWRRVMFLRYYWATKATWTFYTDYITRVKSPMQNLSWTMRMANGAW